jgi:hypothetical protein
MPPPRSYMTSGSNAKSYDYWANLGAIDSTLLPKYHFPVAR